MSAASPPRALALALLVLAACADDRAALPSVRFDAVERGCEGTEACVNAGATEAKIGGIRVIHRPLPGSPLTAVRVFVDGGAMLWTPVSVHAEALLFRMISWWGSAERPGAEFDAEVARIGGRFTTSQGVDFAHVSIVAPSLDFDAAFDLVRSALVAPPIPTDPDAFEHVRGVYESGIDALYDDPASAASQTAWNLVYGGHPYDLRAESADRIDTLGLADVKDAYRELAHKARLVVVVVGDVERERVDTAVADGLARLDSGRPVEGMQPPAAAPSTRLAEVLDYPDAPSWHVRGYFPAPSPFDPKYLPLLLGLSVLDDRLFDELRIARGLVYTAGADVSDLRANYGSVWLSTEHPAEALETFFAVLDAMQTDGPTAEELDAARAQYLTDFFSSNATASGMAWTLGNWELEAGDRALADAHVAALEDVTTEQATEALATYLPGLRLAAAGAGEPLTEAMLTGTPDPTAP